MYTYIMVSTCLHSPVHLHLSQHSETIVHEAALSAPVQQRVVPGKRGEFPGTCCLINKYVQEINKIDLRS